MINELPENLRTKNILIAGLWVQKSEPQMEVFLQPFVDQANKLATTGFSWKLDNKVIQSKVYPLLCCVDSVARCAMLNMKQYNGRFGCTFCEHPTVNVEGVIKYPISTNIPQSRTDASIKRDMILAYQAGERQDINGVWGPSPLMNLQYYDLADGMVADYMHSVLLGVARQYTEIILTSVNEEFYVGSPSKLAVINSRLLRISPPTSISRTPRDLNERKLWKASEWRSWLILYSLVCLQEVLPNKYLRHLLFVAGINILLQTSITLDMLKCAEKFLITFVVLFQQYFKEKAMTFNIHLILHLCEGVRNWGPL
ncbi:PREDICTED: uncharacterized protein LOC105455731 [Wasmannia auropunctata]|uniref:uncharacterized protein LOC105455731 n=1 Tax=Wasmannia auropunctata TaxID=64793 RepID=UPI0005EFAD7B|nr:PREDICTED: uncharacterized protein LOC105455731 [Wasmannia auropunctata]